MKRRNFIKKASATGVGLVVAGSGLSCNNDVKKQEETITTPLIEKERFPLGETLFCSQSVTSPLTSRQKQHPP